MKLKDSIVGSIAEVANGLSTKYTVRSRKEHIHLTNDSMDILTLNAFKLHINVRLNSLNVWSNKTQSAGYEGGSSFLTTLNKGDGSRHHSNVATDSVINWRGVEGCLVEFYP